MQVTTLFPNGTVFGPSSLTQFERTCPTLSAGYWGDYDQMAVHQDGTPAATFYRGFTASTAATCVRQTFRSGPRHVSEVGILAQ